MGFRISQGVIQYYDAGSSSYKGRYRFDGDTGKLVEVNDSNSRVADVSDTTPYSMTKNGSNIFAINLNNATNFLLNAAGTWGMTVTVNSSNVGQSGSIIIKNTAATSPASLPSNLKTPNGDAIAWQTDSGDVSVLSYVVVDTSTVIVNYIGNFG